MSYVRMGDTASIGSRWQHGMWRSVARERACSIQEQGGDTRLRGGAFSMVRWCGVEKKSSDGLGLAVIISAHVCAAPGRQSQLMRRGKEAFADGEQRLYGRVRYWG